MSDPHINYWAEVIAGSLEENVGIAISNELLEKVAADIQCSHENYGLAFYSPPSTDRIHEVEREWERKYKDLEARMENREAAAKKAVRNALHLHRDTNFCINNDGSVERL